MIGTGLLESLEKSYEAFVVPLRMGDGLHQKPFSEFCALLIDCAAAWQSSDSIPKRAANIFVDAYVAMVSSSNWYDEAARSQIEMAADGMNDLIRQCLR